MKTSRALPVMLVAATALFWISSAPALVSGASVRPAMPVPAAPPYRPSAAASVAVSIEPAAQSVAPGGSLSVSIMLAAGDQQVDAVQVTVSYPPDLLEALDADPNLPDVQVTPGATLPTVLKNKVDASSGSIEFSAGRGTLQTPPSGTFTLAQVGFRARAVGSAALRFVDPLEIAMNGVKLQVTKADGSVTIASPSGGGGGSGGGGSSGGGAGSPATPPAAPPPSGSATVSAGQGGSLTTSTAAVQAPPGVVSGAGALTLSVAPALPLGGGSAAPASPLPAGTAAGSAVFTVTLRDDSGNEVHHLDRPLDLTVPYTNSDLNLTGGDPSRLHLQRYDEAAGAWVDLGGQADSAARTVTASTNHLSLFALAARLAPPRVAGPQPGSVAAEMNPLLSWTQASGTVQYHLQVIPFNGDGPGVNLIIGDIDQVAAAQYAVEPPQMGAGNYILLPGMSYTWRVRTTPLAGPVGESDPGWSEWAAGGFRTAPVTSATITPAAPSHGGQSATLTPALRWSDQNRRIFYYEVQLSKDPELVTDPAAATASVYWNLVHGGVTEPLNSYAVPAGSALDADSVYYWRVRPRVQGDGAPVGWSDTWSFRTP